MGLLSPSGAGSDRLREQLEAQIAASHSDDLSEVAEDVARWLEGRAPVEHREIIGILDGWISTVDDWRASLGAAIAARTCSPDLLNTLNHEARRRIDLRRDTPRAKPDTLLGYGVLAAVECRTAEGFDLLREIWERYGASRTSAGRAIAIRARIASCLLGDADELRGCLGEAIDHVRRWDDEEARGSAYGTLRAFYFRRSQHVPILREVLTPDEFAEASHGLRPSSPTT